MRETIAELLVSGKYKLERDGWTNFEVNSPAYDEVFKGIPKEFLEPLVRTHESDFSLKGSLWKDVPRGAVALGDMRREADKLTEEQVKDPEWYKYIDQDVLKRFMEVYIPEQKGVYYLDFLYALEELFSVKADGTLGRGSQAGNIINAIHRHLGIDRDEFGEPFKADPLQDAVRSTMKGLEN